MVKRWLSVALVFAVALGADGTLWVDAGASAPEEGRPYKPVAELAVVMEKVDDVFGKLDDLLKEEKFRTVIKDAAFVAEMMNLASHYDHSSYSKEKGWEDLSAKTRDLLLEASGLAKKKDGAALKGLLERIDASCEACHEKYRDI
jgi:cytochrome c556